MMYTEMSHRVTDSSIRPFRKRRIRENEYSVFLSHRNGSYGNEFPYSKRISSAFTRG